VPKRNGFLSVGVGARADILKERGESIRAYWDDLMRRLTDQSLLSSPPAKANGYSDHLRDSTQAVQLGNAFIVGDAAGLATRDMGEGIGPAVESGIRAAQAIIQGTPYVVDSIRPYSFFDLVAHWRR
jgi:flavin-dependent dehydrogenase